MGTRGTLKVYVNKQLKIRQYNQWDSYPTGQFQTICHFMANEELRNKLIGTLLNTRFATRKEIKHLNDGGHFKEPEVESWLRIQMDRDLGADVLLLLASAPSACKLVPDWVDIFEGEPGSDLEPEEGNYVIHIQCETYPGLSSTYLKEDSVMFKLSGEYHGKKKNCKWGEIPTDEQIKKWEKRGEDW